MNTTFFPQHSLYMKKPKEIISMITNVYKAKHSTKNNTVELFKDVDVEAILIGENRKLLWHTLTSTKTDLVFCIVKGFSIEAEQYSYSDILSANMNNDKKIELKLSNAKTVVFDFGDEHTEISQMVNFINAKVNANSTPPVSSAPTNPAPSSPVLMNTVNPQMESKKYEQTTDYAKSLHTNFALAGIITFFLFVGYFFIKWLLSL